MTLEKLDGALADTVREIGESAPGTIEKIVSAYAEVNVADSSVGLWGWLVGVALFALVALVAYLTDEFGGGKAIAFISVLFSFGCFIGFANSVSTLKAPEAYAIKQLTELALRQNN